jgi:hypothetical protein
MDLLELGLPHKPYEYFIYKDKVEFKMVVASSYLSLFIIMFILFITIF